MSAQEPWPTSGQEGAQGPPQSLPPPPPHAQQSFGNQPPGPPMLHPPALGSNGSQGYYALHPISQLGGNAPQPGGYGLQPISGAPSQPATHSNQSPSMSQSALSGLGPSSVPPQQPGPPHAAGGASLPPPPPPPHPGASQPSTQPGIPTGTPLQQHPGASASISLAQAAAQQNAALAQANGGGAAASAQMATYRPLNVKDALSYLDQVKVQFSSQPDVYNRFLDIMKDFKSQSIDTPGVIDRVSTLFSGHPNLIQGFNTFLPPGYRIECSNDPSDPNPIRVTTPMGTMTRPDGQMPIFDQARAWPPQEAYAPYQGEPLPTGSMNQLQAVANGARPVATQQEKRVGGGPVEFNHAISYVNKIKNRFSSQPEIYKNFLEILQTYQREQKPIADVYAQVTMLFKDAPDLLDDFKQFLPDAAHQRTGTSPDDTPTLSSAPHLPPVGNFAPPSVPKEKKKRSSSTLDQAGSAQVGHSAVSIDTPAHISSMRGSNGKRLKVGTTPKPETSIASPTLTPTIPEPLPPPVKSGPSAEELAFFDRVKKYIGNKQTYNEFLKLLNLFSQNIIDKNVLVEKAEAFIGGNKDLLEWFKRCVGYDVGTLSIENIPYKKHQLELSLCKSYGPSYRLLPKSETHQPCSGRDEMCWEILNDEWVSHPTWASEDSGFVAHRKNQFEEVLHRIEEERHEYDHNVEGNLRTIQILEPIANRIANMSPEEKANFKLPPGLGHSSKSIYQRIIKKIYDRDRGQEVIDRVHDSPAIAIPIVLRRLKQKDEEWKRAQRDWNKVWRETEARVFYKSLDHQGLTFKAADKKTLTTKYLVNEIDTIKKEQFNKRLNLLAPGPKSQLDFSFENIDIIQDALRLLNCHLEHSTSFSSNDREKMDGFIKSFIPLFFGLPMTESGSETPVDSQANSESEDASEAGSTISNSGKKIRSGRDGDLLRDVLKKSRSNRPKNRNDSREATPEVSEETPKLEGASEDKELPEAVEKAGEIWISHVKKSESKESSLSPETKRTKYNLFGNTTIYCFFRLFQVLFQRLEQVKNLEAEVSHDIATRKPVQFAKELGIISNKMEEQGLAFQPENCYGQLLDMCEKVIEGDLEHPLFEESLRQAYRSRAFRMYTVDKVVQAIAKHAHTIISDTKCSEIILLYDRDRNQTKTTTRDQIIYRIQVETILGSDENIFRIEYDMSSYQMQIQQISHEDMTLSDAETAEEKWKYYLTSYVMSAPTEGVPTDKVHMPFLRRNLPTDEGDSDDEEEAAPSETTYSKGTLKVRLSMGTYKMFFEQDTEDFFVRHGLKAYKPLPWKIEDLANKPEDGEVSGEEGEEKEASS
ncbi:uncharacterized protein V1516DRAFT_671173 [Lipomyces oligophaga]|uniref:uncharacterized protein n=1 Tax=Lipomyces oligophaga TaxID=45792 RepID=UPI0034CF3339